MSKAAIDQDQTMSVASEEDVQLQYVPSFETVLRDSDDDSSVPPPPPPSSTRSLKDIGSAIFRSKGKIFQKNHNDDEETGGPSPVEIIASQEESKPNIEVDAAEQWIKSFGVAQERNGRKRRALYCTGIILAFVVILGLAVGLGGDSNKQKTTQSANMLVGSPTTTDATDIPATTSPPTTAVVTTMPPVNETETELETEAPMNATSVPVNVPVNETDVPAQPCNALLNSQETCYTRRTEITISFTNCQAESKDWIGIWNVDDAIDSASLPEPAIWLWTCGSQDCEGVVEEDDLLFENGLPLGNYVAHLLRMDQANAPYTGSYASSETFEVSRNCN